MPPAARAVTLLLFVSLVSLAPAASSARPAGVRFDCNQNGVDDAVDIALGTSGDANANGVPDECEGDRGSRALARP